MRTILYRFDELGGFAVLLRDASLELPLPEGEMVADGEWVLAMFEVGKRGRATAAAARASHTTPRVLTFERRDWERLQTFAESRSEHMPVAAPSILERGSSSGDRIGTEERQSRPSLSGLKSSRFAQHSGARVLLVDDDEGTCDVVGAMLEAVGLTIETAPSAELAAERLEAAGFDLVVMDWALPGMNGLELCKKLRHDPKTLRLPILFLSAHAGSREIVEAFASGADDYVVKPFRAPELGARIFSLLRRARMSQPA